MTLPCLQDLTQYLHRCPTHQIKKNKTTSTTETSYTNIIYIRSTYIPMYSMSSRSCPIDDPFIALSRLYSGQIVPLLKRTLRKQPSSRTRQSVYMVMVVVVVVVVVTMTFGISTNLGMPRTTLRYALGSSPAAKAMRNMSAMKKN
ncbi:hypothetical protein L249_3382 [Ophiocordyceps polyrhachis-furcata BCC 54312]|uniref:Transmembrane protein n=1 Tax=Ophiocordyceps polyrhachis-furcata BCC 54312 TaxID=1330021 RepID=A0A367LMS7_9HYPO|nr:hypothetical protein L249_3382 [Ophiocordyceps polyrhachis-furcata BCC 54312]